MSRSKKRSANRYTWLLGALLLMLIIGPLIGRFELVGAGIYVGDFILAIVLLSAIRFLFERHLHFGICLGLAVLAMLAGGSSRMLSPEIAIGVRVAGHVMEALLLGYMMVLIGLDIFRTDEVDGDTIAGSISVYLLLASLFAVVFTIVGNLNPDAFRMPGDLAAPDGSMGPDRVMVYFSLTTITTLGYGDITPRGEMARSLSNLEALLGQVYLTVLVARLVGRNLSRVLRPS